MTEADVMFLARDCSAEILKAFERPPFESEDIGKLTLGSIVGFDDFGDATVIRVRASSVQGRDDVRRAMQDTIEASIREALRRHGEDLARDFGGKR